MTFDTLEIEEIASIGIALRVRNLWLIYSLIKRTVYQTISGFMKSPKGTLAKSLPVESIRQNLFTRLLSNDPLSGCSVPAPIMMCAVY